MNWKKVLEKGLKGIATIVASLLVANHQPIVDFVIGFLPEGLDPQMTIAGVVGGLIVAATNWLKHRGQ